MNGVFARDDPLFAEVIDAADALQQAEREYSLCIVRKTGGGYPTPVGFADSRPLESPPPNDEAKSDGNQRRGD